MRLQSIISRKINSCLVGETLPVLVEGVSKESEMLWQGRTESQAPDIDGVVYLRDGITTKNFPGELNSVRIEEAYDYDLVGTLVG